MGPATSRADLLRALAAMKLLVEDSPASAAKLPQVARLLGFEAPTEAPPPREEEEGFLSRLWEWLRGRKPAEAAAAPLEVASQDQPACFRPVPFWRLEAIHARQPVEKEELALSPAVPTSRSVEPTVSARPSACPPLSSWSRLWPSLREALEDSRVGRDLDIPLLVAAWGRGRLLPRLPRIVRRCWPSHVTLYVDHSDRLIPFWSDQAEVRKRLQRLCGLHGVSCWTYPQGLEGVAVDPHGLPTLRKPSRRGTVLALTDLGWYGSAAQRWDWLREVRRLEREGQKAVALVPVPVDRWQPTLARLWGALVWERPAGQGACDESERNKRAERLLALLSPAVRVEPLLMRKLRRKLPRHLADVGTEADAWAWACASSGGASASAVTVANEREVAETLRGRFAKEERSLQETAVQALREQHRDLPAEIWHEEVQILAQAGGADLVETHEREASREYLSRLWGELMVDDPASAKERDALALWCRRFEGRLPPTAWHDSELAEPLARMWAIVHRDDRDAVAAPPGTDLALLERMLGPETGPPGRFELRQMDDQLAFVVAPSDTPTGPPDAPASGSPLVTVVAARRLADISTLGEGRTTWRVPIDKTSRRLLSVTSGLQVRTDRTEARLGLFERPKWARAAGRDGFGLWVEVEVRSVRFRLRWIPPGEFLMGSPPGEAGRYEDEGPAHEVELREGYWLGEVPVTQALWEAVMGANPSRFKSPDRPVEQVSWEDCGKFLQRGNEAVPGLEVRLPTEAQWEYACRAGTKTSTYAGELKILGDNNGPLLDEIAWYGGNSGIDFKLEEGADSSGWPNKQYEHSNAGTHPVGEKRPNPWGLFDMLGNVYEWCSDWKGNYDDKRAVNPTGSDMGRGRVIRGGSWLSVARYVRSAFRFEYVPGLRYGSLGFRLARGQ